MIISGFPGIGKSFLAKHNGMVIDLDSSLFLREKNWQETYINVANHLSQKHFVVVISSHDIVREHLIIRKIPYYLVYPKRELKQEYIKRYEDRGNNEKFIQLLDSSWDDFINSMEFDPIEDNHYILESGQYLNDILTQIVIRDLKDVAEGKRRL